MQVGLICGTAKVSQEALSTTLMVGTYLTNAKQQSEAYLKHFNSSCRTWPVAIQVLFLQIAALLATRTQPKVVQTAARKKVNH